MVYNGIIRKRKRGSIMAGKATALQLNDGDYEYLKSLIKHYLINIEQVVRWKLQTMLLLGL